MSTYQYTAKNKSGQAVSGMLEAASEPEAINILHSKELVVISIKETKTRLMRARGGRIKSEDLVIFSRQLATMIDAGIALVQALGILSEQVESRALKNVVMSVRQDIERGVSFSDALARHPQAFSELFINMSRAGEASGMLDEVLDRLATYLEKSAALNRKIRSSLIYPAVVVSMAIIITAFLLIKVVPTFKGIFEMLGGQLPLPTQILIGISDLLRRAFLFVIGLLVIFIFLFKKYINTKKGRYRFDALKLKAPILGQLFRKVAIAKFSRTFATLVKSGITVLNALNIVAKTSGNRIVEEVIMDCQESVRNGEPLSRPLSKSSVFPAMVWRMIGIGEQTGELEKMLAKIADFYDEQVDVAVSGLTSIIEPLVIAFLGIVVGGIVISLFMPIFKISELIAH